VVDGISFHSKREARRYRDLLLLIEAGEIQREGFQLQPRFPCTVNGQLVCTYVADFAYKIADQDDVTIEDCKGYKTDLYKLKKKLVEAVYGITIKET